MLQCEPMSFHFKLLLMLIHQKSEGRHLDVQLINTSCLFQHDDKGSWMQREEILFLFLYLPCCVSVPPFVFLGSYVKVSYLQLSVIMFYIHGAAAEETVVYRPISFWGDSILNPHLWPVRLNSVMTWRTHLARSLRAQRNPQKGYAWTSLNLCWFLQTNLD